MKFFLSILYIFYYIPILIILFVLSYVAPFILPFAILGGIYYLYQKRYKKNNSNFIKIRCEKCGQKMRLPEKDKNLKFNCPNCSKEFKLNPEKYSREEKQQKIF